MRGVGGGGCDGGWIGWTKQACKHRYRQRETVTYINRKRQKHTDEK